MKTILKTLFIIITSMLAFSFTTNNEKGEPDNSIQGLSSDARFIALAQAQVQAMNNVTDFDALEAFANDDNLSDSDINQIASLLGYPSTATYESYLSNQKDIIKELDDDYNLSNYSEAQLTQLSLNALNSNKSKAGSRSRSKSKYQTGEIPIIIDVEPTGETNECEDLCEEVRVACLLEVAAAATAAHIGCGIADITIIAGIACHSAVLVAQVAGSNKCNKEAKKCVADCRRK